MGLSTKSRLFYSKNEMYCSFFVVPEQSSLNDETFLQKRFLFVKNTICQDASLRATIVMGE